jgi:hypothetical protein
MENLFGFLMYNFFGKRWVLHTMREGYKVAVFMDRVNIEMLKNKVADAEYFVENRKNSLENVKNKVFVNKEEKEESVKNANIALENAEKEVRIKTSEIDQMYDQLQNDKYKRDFIINYKI